jgi:molybdopterin/thiamine biosynthesis adenylyltransferase
MRVVLEGADNYPTKFLAADAALLERKPIVHGAAIGWRGTAWAIAPEGAPCYRCLFEDLPGGVAQNCSSRGVMGPVVGLVGALMADLTLRVISARANPSANGPWGKLITFDGRSERLREVRVGANSSCALCGVAPSIVDIDRQHYTSEASAA